MLLRMPSPIIRDGSTFKTFRQRVPADLLGKALGMVLRVPVGDVTATVRIGRTGQVKLSLRTRDPREAKARQAKVLAYLDETRRSLRDGPQSLSHKQIIALAGDFRRRAIAKFEDEPGPVGIWVRFLELSEGWDEAARARQFAPLVEEHLARHARNVDQHTKAALTSEMFRVGVEVVGLMKRRAEGDYTTDEGASRFPMLYLDVPGNGTDVSIRGLFNGGKLEAQIGAPRLPRRVKD